MTREQAINYMFCSGFSEEQVSEVVRALTYEPTTKNDLGVDCISRDDVRDVMQELWGTSGELMDRLMALPSVTPQEPRWIPVSEGLPEKAFGCIVTVEVDNILTGEPVPTVLSYVVGYDGETWNDADGITIPYEIIAWMPLPKSYSEDEE